jgi:putative Mn2+ efflux pump MntP
MGSEPDRMRRLSSRMINGVSRALAVVLFMAIPGLIGSYLDRQFHTQYWTVLGMCAGMVFGIAGLLLIVTIMNKQEEEEARLEDQSPGPKPVYRKYDFDDEDLKEDDF